MKKTKQQEKLDNDRFEMMLDFNTSYFLGECEEPELKERRCDPYKERVEFIINDTDLAARFAGFLLCKMKHLIFTEGGVEAAREYFNKALN